MDKGLLNEATSPDDTPTPGYMLTEISRLTIANYQACLQLIEFLNARLKKNNHNVKFKCLVIIKHACRNGRADFKKEMARNLDPVKECLQYKGPPDPLRGDEIYKRVRDAAKEALDAIFDSQMPMTTSAVSNRIQGFSGGDDTRVASTQPQSSSSSFNFSFRSDSDGGSYIGATEGDISGARGGMGYNNPSFQPPNVSSNSGNSNTNNTSNSSGMVGISNPNFKDPRNEVSLMQKMAALAEGALGSSSSSSSSQNNSNFGGSGNNNINNNNNTNNSNTYNNSDYQMRSNRDSPFGTAHKSSPYLPHITGPWNQNTPSSPTNSSPLPLSGGIVPDIPSITGGIGRAGQAASDGSYEQTLVASLCEPGGMKAVPPEDKLEEFLTTASTLSPELIGSNLLGFINSDSWQSRAKALIVISSLVKRSGCSQHYDWWINNGVEDIQILSQTDSKATVKTQAIKTLRSLGVSISASSIVNSSPTVSTTPSNQNQKTSLLDFENEEVNNVKSQNIETQPNIPQGGSLIDFLEQQQPSQPPPPTPQQQQQSNSTSGGDNLFFGLSVGTSNVPQQQVQISQPPVTIPQSSNSQSGSLFDFIESTPIVQQQHQQQPTPTIDLNSLYGPSVGIPNQQPPPIPPANNGPLAGLNLSVPVRMPNQYPPQQLPPGYPPQSYPSYPPHQQYPPQQYPPQQQQPQYTPMVPSAMGMNNPQLGVRKVIPDATSGFSFLESNGQKKNSDDAFSFVKDAMQKK